MKLPTQQDKINFLRIKDQQLKTKANPNILPATQNITKTNTTVPVKTQDKIKMYSKEWIEHPILKGIPVKIGSKQYKKLMIQGLYK